MSGRDDTPQPEKTQSAHDPTTHRAGDRLLRWGLLGWASLLLLALVAAVAAMPGGGITGVVLAGYGGGPTPEFNCPASAPSLAFLNTSATPQPRGGYEPEKAAARVSGQPWGPLHTNGNKIVEVSGKPIRLAAVNWYGAESGDFVPMGLANQTVEKIAQEIAAMGFNAVRLPWSNELVECNPIVPDALVADNPQFYEKPAMAVFDGVVNALAKAGLMVILDNHMTDAAWCCEASDENDLWWSGHGKREDFSTGQAHWTEDWETMTQRYANQPAVIGVDLRNEPRGAAYWGRTTNGQPNGEVADSSQAPPNTLQTCPIGNLYCDWRWAAQEEGNAIEARHPERFLIFVEGTSLATDLTGAYSSPVVLTDPTALVYSPHVYTFADYCDANSHSQCPSPSAWEGGVSSTGSPPPSFGFLRDWRHLRRALDSQWGFLAGSGDNQQKVTPLWIGEFGTNAWTGAGPGYTPERIRPPSEQNRWFRALSRYLVRNRNFGWAYWALNGTKADGAPTKPSRKIGELESYGILNLNWTTPVRSPKTEPSLLSYLAEIQH